MSVDRCWNVSVDRRRIPLQRGMVEKSIFLSTNTSVLCSSFLLVILIILLCMQCISGEYHSVYRHGGIVVAVLPISWTIVDRFLLRNVDRFLMSTVDRCYSVSFNQR